MRAAVSFVLVLDLALAGCEPGGSPVAAGAAAGSSTSASTTAGRPAGASSAAPEFSSLDRAIKARDQRIRELDDALASLAEKIAKLEAALQRVEDDNAKTHLELDQARRTLDALRAASPLPNLAYDVPKVAGHVLSLGRDELGPVVLLDVGRKQGVEARFEFTIARAGKAIAKVSIDKVENEVSRGRIVYAKDGETVREGDEASTRP